MPLWTSTEIKEATSGEVIGDWHVDGVSIDTRSIVKGDLFVALNDKRDGHDFVKAAFEKGASAALVSHIPLGLDNDAALVIVTDVAKALKNIAQEYEIPVVSPYQMDATGEARFAKGLLDSADAAYTLNSHTKEDACMSFDCVKMRDEDEVSFTSQVNWSSLKIGPLNAKTPSQKEKEEGASEEEPAFDL
jgi:hypothetical protein